MILLQPNKKRREPGIKCHAENYDAQQADKALNMTHHVPLRQTVAELRPKIGVMILVQQN
jgi:hypothetical protein